MQRFTASRSLVLAAMLMGHGVAFAADPTTADCLNAYEHSIALRNKAQLRAARAELLVCAAPTCPEDIRNECARRVSEVNAAMPTIVFEVRDIRDNDLSAVAVSMDGQPLVPRLEGTALSIDPGEHQFVFTAQNVAPVTKSLIIREGEKGRREKIILGGEVMAPEKVAAAQAAQAPTEPADTSDDSSQETKRIVGIAVGSAGLVSLGVALYMQITALDRDSQSQDAAASDDPQSQEDAQVLHDQAKQAQTYAIIFGSVGAAALGTGLYLLITSLGDDEPSNPPAVRLHVVPSIDRAAAGVTYVRTF